MLKKKLGGYYTLVLIVIIIIIISRCSGKEIIKASKRNTKTHFTGRVEGVPED